jgi:DNA-binding beta-propeller fold protein YncE
VRDSVASLPRIPLRLTTAAFLILLGALGAACGPLQPNGLPILGGFTHSPDAVQIEVIASAGDGLATPRDLAFHSQRDGELWIANLGDGPGSEVMVILHDAGTRDQEAIQRSHPTGEHFFARPSGIAFAADGTLASIHETDELTQGPFGSPPDFMGPTLHSSDLDIFDAGWGGHLDMLHNTPNGMGIAWQRERDFWVFDGYHDSLTLYEFNDDHGPGGEDHTDGVVSRWVEGEVSRVPDVPSHLVFRRQSQELFVADTGNNRIAVLDTTSGRSGGDILPNYDFTEQFHRLNANLFTLIDGEVLEDVLGVEEFEDLQRWDMELPPMRAPSGLALHDGMLYVSDNQTGVIYAFDLDGVLVDWVETGRKDGALMGMDFDEDGRLYVIDARADEIIRISPLNDPAN